ncbi:Homeodomain-like protein [Gorgonomyces haynaldii]|nr:Homeodomain-like protein [Gorgonomyces haynaldii]
MLTAETDYPSPLLSPIDGFPIKPFEMKLSRRKSKPHRALQVASECKQSLGIVQLDVFKLYRSNPRKLLSPREKRDQSVNLNLYKDTYGAPQVLWKKGGVLYICPSSPGYDQITPEELNICQTLRILPDQYLHIKETILSQVLKRGPFKKRDAKSWFRIDVNKTAIIFDWFKALGWIPNDDEWESKRREP